MELTQEYPSRTVYGILFDVQYADGGLAVVHHVVGHAAHEELLEGPLVVLGHDNSAGVQLVGTLANDGACKRKQAACMMAQAQRAGGMHDGTGKV